MLVIAFVSLVLLSVGALINSIRLIKQKKILLGILFLILTLTGIILGIVYSYKSNEKLNATEKKIEDIKQYVHVSALNYNGLKIQIGAGLTSSDPLYLLMKDTYTINDGLVVHNCGSEFEKKYKKAIELQPKFPFSYFALAVCKKEKNEENWKDYANEAVKILEVTTTINGHKPEHDGALEILLDYLADN